MNNLLSTDCYSPVLAGNSVKRALPVLYLMARAPIETKSVKRYFVFKLFSDIQFFNVFFERACVGRFFQEAPYLSLVNIRKVNQSVTYGHSNRSYKMVTNAYFILRVTLKYDFPSLSKPFSSPLKFPVQ